MNRISHPIRPNKTLHAVQELLHSADYATLIRLTALSFVGQDQHLLAIFARIMLCCTGFRCDVD
jgi:hypothetical protein